MAVKRYVLALSLALVTAVAAGCGSGTGTDQGSASENKAVSGEQTAVSEEQKVALPEGNPTFMGKVTDIVGNEVTVLKAQLPAARPAATEQSAGAGESQTGNQTPNQVQGQATDGTVAQPRGMAMKFAEEPTTFVIPVGTSIVTVQRGSNEGTQADLADIKKDCMVRVWLTDDTVTFVQVTGLNTQRSGGQDAAGTRQGGGAGAGMGAGGGPVIFQGPPGGGG